MRKNQTPFKGSNLEKVILKNMPVNSFTEKILDLYNNTDTSDMSENQFRNLLNTEQKRYLNKCSK
jgi:hypothetical protein